MPDTTLRKKPDAFAPGLCRVVAAATLSATALFSSFAADAFAKTVASPPISVNGSALSIGGLERDNNVFVPVRGVFEKLGAQVADTGSSVVATRQGKELARMTVGNRSAAISGITRTLPVAPFLASGHVMLPLRVISEAAGATVAYTSTPRGVNITRAVVAAAGAGAAAPVADVASAAPVAATQTNQNAIPWWVWALLALLLLALIAWALMRRTREPMITTTGARHNQESTVTTAATGRSNEPTIKTGK